MSPSLQPDAHLLPFKDQFQILDGRRPDREPLVPHGSWYGGSDTVGSTSYPKSESYEAGPVDAPTQDRQPSVRQPLAQGGYNQTSWSQIHPELQHQARWEYDYGGPVISLERNSGSLNLPGNEPDGSHPTHSSQMGRPETEEEKERRELEEMLMFEHMNPPR